MSLSACNVLSLPPLNARLHGPSASTVCKRSYCGMYKRSSWDAILLNEGSADGVVENTTNIIESY